MRLHLLAVIEKVPHPLSADEDDGWPMCDEDREALSLPDVQMPDGISDRQLCSMAGNAMFGPCCAMAIFAALLYVERIS